MTTHPSQAKLPAFAVTPNGPTAAPRGTTVGNIDPCICQPAWPPLNGCPTHGDKAQVRRLEAENAELRRDLEAEIGNVEQADALLDKLAEAIARMTGIEIGEHSNSNDPWANALEAAGRVIGTEPAREQR